MSKNLSNLSSDDEAVLSAAVAAAGGDPIARTGLATVTQSHVELLAWANGTATGGVNGSGSYNFTLADNSLVAIPCPAKTLQMKSKFTTLSDMKAAALGNAVYELASATGSDSGTTNGKFVFQTGDYTGKDDEKFVVKLNNVALTIGALVRVGADTLSATLPGSNTVTDVLSVLNVIVTVERFAAHKVGDDWGPAIQAAMDYCSSVGGGRVTFERKGYDNYYSTSNLYWRQYVFLDGGDYLGRGAGAVLRPYNLTPNSFLIDADATQPLFCGLVGMGLRGNFSGGTTGAVRSPDSANAFGILIKWCAIDNWSREAVLLRAGGAIIKENAMQGLNNPGLFGSTQTGVLWLSGADNQVRHNEVAGPGVHQPSICRRAGGNLAAARFEGLGVSLIEGNIWETADSGCNHLGDQNRHIGNRYDTNAGEGLLLGGTNNVSIGEAFGRNNFRYDKQEDGTTNNPVFDHIYSPTGQSYGNRIIAPTFYNSQREDGTWAACRYIVNDQTTGYNDPNQYIFPDKNMTGPLDGNNRPNYLSGYWNLATSPDGGSTVTLAESNRLRSYYGQNGSVTPSVLNQNKISLADGYSAGTAITNFTEGFPGQKIDVEIGSCVLTEGPHLALRGKSPITNTYVVLENRGGNGTAAIWTLIGGLF